MVRTHTHTHTNPFVPCKPKKNVTYQKKGAIRVPFYMSKRSFYSSHPAQNSLTPATYCLLSVKRKKKFGRLVSYSHFRLSINSEHQSIIFTLIRHSSPVLCQSLSVIQFKCSTQNAFVCTSVENCNQFFSTIFARFVNFENGMQSTSHWKSNEDPCSYVWRILWLLLFVQSLWLIEMICRIWRVRH